MRRSTFSFLLLLAVVLVSHHVTPASSINPPEMMSVSPPRPRVGDQMSLKCHFDVYEICFDDWRMRAQGQFASVNITMYRKDVNVNDVRWTRTELASQDMNCRNTRIERFEVSVDNASLARPSCCAMMTLENLVANESWQGEYLCDVVLRKLGSTHIYTSRPMQLKVMDKSNFTVTRFTLTDADTGAAIDPGSSVAAGTNVIAVCETEVAQAAPTVTVSVTGGGPPVVSRPPFDNRVELFAVVPRQPRVEFVCRVFDGIGEPLIETLAIQSEYGPVRSEMTMLQQADSRKVGHELLCSARNNPPKPLLVSGLDEVAKVVQVEMKPGLSEVYADFKSSRVDRLVAFTCGVNGSIPLRGSLRLFGSECGSYYWCRE